MNVDVKKIFKSTGFKIVASSIVIAGSITGGYIIGFENAQGLPATYKYYPSNKVLATVGDTTIKVDVLKKQMSMYFASMPQKELTQDEISYQESTYIDYIITKEALKQKALKKGLSVEDEIVQSQYEELMKKLENLYGLTTTEIFDKFNITEAFVKEAVKDELLGNTYLDSVSKVSDETATEYYNSNPNEFIECEASHILIKTVDDNYESLSDEKVADAEKRAKEVLDKALSGDDFASLAKEYSEDASASEGGSLGYFKKGEMVTEFEEAAFSLKTGEITDTLVKTEFGYHIIKKTGEKQTTLEDALASIKDNLAYEKKYNTMKEILDSPDIEIKYGK